jgi:D-beta-D-heptose 7-phosphate kinase/D-beta-D-heptose 1-phosphate adenosyltransferase
MTNALIELVDKLPGQRITLVGDLMIDRYVYGNAERLSPDAPVPVIHYQKEDFRLGGAGRVAADLGTLGAKTRVIGIIGTDDDGRHITQLLRDQGCDTLYLIQTSDRPSTSKVRLVGLAQHRHAQQMIRLDYEDASPITGELITRLLAAVEQSLEDCDVLCIEDYNKGLLPTAVCRQIIKMARAKKIPTIVDPAAIDDYSKYTGATALKPNRFEASRATGSPETIEGASESAQKLIASLNLEAAIVTMDRHGIFLATRDGQLKHIHGRERKAYDVAGAGDMLLAMLAASRAAGATWEQAAALGNVAAGLECEKFGSVPITRQEIITDLLIEAHFHLGKVRTLEAMLPELLRHRAAGKKIVFTNGCFDLIHPGHTKYFRFAKRQGDLLVVGVNTDASIRRLKGDKRPIINESDRLEVLEELQSIDYLITFDTDSPRELIEAIRPDVLVKGADYSVQQVVGHDFVESYGGKIALAPLIDGKSTSAVIGRILDAHRDTPQK